MKKQQTIDLTPTWEGAVKIYMAVLENEQATFEGKKAAREELVRLARIVDNMKEGNEG
jgi:hypothetical protein|tara:strand:- start:170 stop:343 length:174 start_codon:yes stop_codon:yes gene_type:complete